MSLNPQALTTVARVKTYMNKSGTSDDTLLAILINVCTDFLENYCSRRFKKTAYSQEVYDGSGTRMLILKNYPVDTSVAFTLEQRDTPMNENHWSAIDSSLYHVDYETGLVTLMSGLTVFQPMSGVPLQATNRFTKFPRQFRVTYTAGYAFENQDTNNLVTTESAGCGDLEAVCWMLVKNTFQGRQANTNISQESIGDYSVTFRQSAMMDPLVSQLLQNYVRADANL